MFKNGNLMIKDYLALIKPERMYKQPSQWSLLTYNLINGNNNSNNNASLVYEGGTFNSTKSPENSNYIDNIDSPSSLLDRSPHSSDEAPISFTEFFDPFYDQMSSINFASMDVNSTM